MPDRRRRAGRGPHVRRGEDAQRAAGRPAGGGEARAVGAGAGGQHRQRTDRGVAGRRVPGCWPSTAPTCTSPAWSGTSRSPLTAGGRVDLGLTMPANGKPLRVQVSKGTAVILGTGDLPPPPQPVEPLNLLAYGTPDPEGLGFDPDQPDRTFEYSIGRRPGFVRGWPGLWWSINGRTVPERADVRRPRGRRGPDAHRRPQRRRCTRCTCTATTRWCWPATGWPRPAAPGGWTRSTCATARPTTSPSSPTTPGCGWTTATISSTPPTGWWRT